MNALILHPLVARERLAAERDAGRAEGMAAGHAAAGLDYGEGLEEGLDAALWALGAIQAADATTLRGRILTVAVQTIGPDDAVGLVALVDRMDDDAAMRWAVRRLARAVL